MPGVCDVCDPREVPWKFHDTNPSTPTHEKIALPANVAASDFKTCVHQLLGCLDLLEGTNYITALHGFR